MSQLALGPCPGDKPAWQVKCASTTLCDERERGKEMAGGLVTIAQYRDLPEAGLAKSKLQAAGIPCFLDNEYTVGVNWLYSNALGGLKLNVPEECAEEAKAIIEESIELVASEESGELLSDSACPACGSTKIEPNNYTRKFAALTLLVSLPLFLFWKRYSCKSCGHRWK